MRKNLTRAWLVLSSIAAASVAACDGSDQMRRTAGQSEYVSAPPAGSTNGGPGRGAMTNGAIPAASPSDATKTSTTDRKSVV